jgi:ATP-dependent RNA helicase DeaD
MTTFADLSLEPSILQALEKMQYHEPSAVQAAAIPPILAGRDLIVLAHTGSGKTAACAIPVCHKIDVANPKIQALIVVPTRELALQYASETQKIGAAKQIKAFALLGGESSGMQQSKLKHGVHILVATPGRLIDFIYSRLIDLSGIEILVLDEADEMLSMGFAEDLEFIMQCLNAPHQTLLFSATMPPLISKLAKTAMRDPLEISLTADQGLPSSVEHHFLYCRHDQRISALTDQIKGLQPQQSIIFCHSRIEVEKVRQQLQKTIPGVDFLHAGLSQDMRSLITNKFRTGKIKHLVATDVVSRGVDFSGITHVFIYHLGDDPDIYVHRSGRTGRYNKSGMVVTLVTERELYTLDQILKRLNRAPSWIGSPPPDKPHSKPPVRSHSSTHRPRRSSS